MGATPRRGVAEITCAALQPGFARNERHRIPPPTIPTSHSRIATATRTQEQQLVTALEASRSMFSVRRALQIERQPPAATSSATAAPRGDADDGHGSDAHAGHDRCSE